MTTSCYIQDLSTCSQNWDENIGSWEAVKRHQRSCFECKKWRGKPEIPMMVDFPQSNLLLFHLASYSMGIDCFGPFQVKFGKTLGNTVQVPYYQSCSYWASIEHWHRLLSHVVKKVHSLQRETIWSAFWWRHKFQRRYCRTSECLQCTPPNLERESDFSAD